MPTALDNAPRSPRKLLAAVVHGVLGECPHRVMTSVR
jgi:hypothetical protein